MLQMRLTVDKMVIRQFVLSLRDCKVTDVSPTLGDRLQRLAVVEGGQAHTASSTHLDPEKPLKETNLRRGVAGWVCQRHRPVRRRWM